MKNIPPETIKKLKTLSKKFETKDFLKDDPSQFIYYYPNPQDIELCSFIASLLSFGNRKQFIPKIRFIMEQADSSGGIYKWIKNFDFEKIFSISDNRKYYRFYSYKDFYYLFFELHKILLSEKSLGIFFSTKYQEALSCKDFSSGKIEKINLIDLIPKFFPNCKIVPSTKSSAKKRLCMFLRWMVRTNSPVDIGLWPWYSKNDLLIPMDVHVLEEAQNLNLLHKNATATRKYAEELTSIAKQIFPGDPCKLDFALFGLGVTKKI